MPLTAITFIKLVVTNSLIDKIPVFIGIEVGKTILGKAK
jgi:hypothetical protein